MSRLSAITAALSLFAALAPLPAQELTDQFGASVDVGAEPSSGRLVVVWSDRREAPDDIAAWLAAIGSSLPPGTGLLAVADLKAVPFFVPRAGIIKGVADSVPTRPVLLDWKGELIKRLGFKKGGPLVLVLGPGGSVKVAARGGPSPEGAAALAAALR
ncbi:MAG: hypothetical protein KKA67_11870 [Spirochaetes bacterium]|nr:hypothetical protein [Spirochaetota bacterium]MBU1081429.1 hypothetical protein [Spirochaetota bacterium]